MMASSFQPRIITAYHVIMRPAHSNDVIISIVTLAMEGVLVITWLANHMLNRQLCMVTLVPHGANQRFISFVQWLQ